MCISAERRVVTTKGRRAMMGRKMSSYSSHHDATPEHLASFASQDELLQACLRYDWDQVEHWCTIFASCIKHSSCQDDLVRQQLLQQDSWGNTPLHAACHYNPPLTIVHAILQLAKKTGVRHHLCTLPNTNGAVPVVVACTTGGASMPVLLLLLRDLESKDQLCDSKGNSAIGGLLDRYQMLRKVPKFAHSMLALKDISSIHHHHCSNNNNNNSSSSSTQQEEAKEEIHNNNNNNTIMMHLLDDMAVGGFDQCWAKMEILLQTAWLLEFDGSLDDYTPLHGAANVASQIPFELSELLIRCHSRLVSTPTRTGGLLPLHLAIQDHGATIFVQQLIRADPSTASCPHPTTGQLPLVQAIGGQQQQFSWNAPLLVVNNNNAIHNNDEDEILSQGGILQQLWKAYPEALDQQDAQTGLYPAFVAATTTTITQKEGDLQQQLDTVFSMLRLNPSIVAGN